MNCFLAAVLYFARRPVHAQYKCHESTTRAKITNTEHTCEFVKIKLFKDAEIWPGEHAVQNRPPFSLGVGVEQRLHRNAVGEEEHTGNDSEVHQFLQLQQTVHTLVQRIRTRLFQHKETDKHSQ